MFILNNIYDRKYSTLYKKRGDARPVFDISDDQLASAKIPSGLKLKAARSFVLSQAQDAYFCPL